MLEDKDKSNKNKIQVDELDLIARLKTVWSGRRKIIKITFIFTFIGLFIAVFSEKEYTATTTIVPQTSGGKSIGGNLGGLAAIAGIELGGSSSNDSGISPLLYPHILNSVPFQKELLNTPLTIDGYEKPVTFQEYYTNIYSPGLLSILKKYTVGLPGVIMNSVKGESTKKSLKSLDSSKQFLQINSKEKIIIDKLNKQISLLVKDKDGYVTLSSTMPEALNAAELNQNVQELLQKYVIDFKIKKSKNKLNFIKERFGEKEKVYKETQIKLATFQDKNKFMSSALAQNTLIRYQAEYDLAFEVYSQLAKQQEAQQIKVKEDTPVFTILEPVFIPNEKSNPKRLKIILSWAFLGFIFGVAFVFSKSYITQFMRKIRKD
jgi:uncharacterized protein involved in exopolysaccharide biosynthesis